jgi:hypothetical protein
MCMLFKYNECVNWSAVFGRSAIGMDSEVVGRSARVCLVRVMADLSPVVWGFGHMAKWVVTQSRTGALYTSFLSSCQAL